MINFLYTFGSVRGAYLCDTEKIVSLLCGRIQTLLSHNQSAFTCPVLFEALGSINHVMWWALRQSPVFDLPYEHQNRRRYG